METIGRLDQGFSGVSTFCGLSKVSLRLPNRFLVNPIFMVLRMGAGLAGAIADPLNEKRITNIWVARNLGGVMSTA